jgi:O-antigen/teichoic acid export membrane protein
VITVIAFATNALMNFVVGLLVAWFLGPQAFGIYAIGATLLVLLNAAFLDWVKLSAVRFYTKDSETRITVRRSLDSLFTYSVLGMAAVAFSGWLVGVNARLPLIMMAATVAAAIGGGLFDYTQAIARARQDDAAYARLVIVKNGLALLLMVAGAWWFQSPALVMAGAAVSSFLAVGALWRRLQDAPFALRPPEKQQALVFAHYAAPLIVANVLYATIPLLNRVIMADRFGLDEAGIFALASDIGFKLLCTTSAAFEILTLPAVVAIAERGTLSDAYKAISRNSVIGLAVMLPLATGFVLVLPAFEQVIVPPAFRGRFSDYIIWLMPAFLALCLAQTCFSPVFMVARQTRVALLTGALAVLVNLALLYGLPRMSSPQHVALAMSAGFASGMLILAIGALRVAEARPALRDVGVILLATTLMAMCLWPFRTSGPALLNLPVMAGSGTIIYSAVLLAFNVAGSRDWLGQRLRRTHS